MVVVRVARFFSALAAASVLLAACSWFREDEEISYPDSFSEVEWAWESSELGRGGRILSLPRGVAVVDGRMVFALSGTNGREMWSYSDEENQAEEVSLSQSGEFLVWKVVLEELGVWERGEREAEHWFVNPVTGEVVHKLPISGYFPPRLFAGLVYVQEEESGKGDDTHFSAYEVVGGGNDEPVWTSEAHLRCETEPDFDVRNQDPVLARGVVVIPYTCVEDEISWQSSDRQTVVAGLLGLDIEDGEELWRSETTMEEASLYDSYNREIVPMNTDYTMVYGTYGHPDMFMHVRTGEVVPDMEAMLPGPDDASWMVEVQGGDEYVRLGEGLREEARVDFSGEADRGRVVPLEEGLATVVDVESDPKAVFQPWDEEAERVYVDLGIAGDEVLDMTSVPGAVVVLYRSAETGDLGVIGLA